MICRSTCREGAEAGSAPRPHSVEQLAWRGAPSEQAGQTPARLPGTSPVLGMSAPSSPPQQRLRMVGCASITLRKLHQSCTQKICAECSLKGCRGTNCHEYHVSPETFLRNALTYGNVEKPLQCTLVYPLPRSNVYVHMYSVVHFKVSYIHFNRKHLSVYLSLRNKDNGSHNPENILIIPVEN